MSLFGRIFLLNAIVLVVAGAALLLGPVTVSTPVLLTEVLIVGTGVAAVLVANALLIKFGLAPLDRLTRAMRTADLLKPVPRLPARGRGEVAELIRTFNAMLDRLEAERGFSAARALSAQEAERRRVAQELHDEVGQTLTAVLLELKRVADHADDEVRKDLHQVQETTRASLDEIRRIARRLRPGVLEELGLTSALKALASESSDRAGLTVRHRIDPDIPPLDPQVELVIYRVAQEALTNTTRHARATRAELHLHVENSAVVLRVRDNGRGIGDSAEGAGISGMRERALLIGAQLQLASPPGGGTEVCLSVPVREPERR